MASRYHFGDNEKPHFITFAVVNWIDVFTRAANVQVLLDSLKFCIEKKGLKLHAWVIMSNHVHLIASAKEGIKLADIMRDMKKFTSRQIIASIEQNEQESRKDWMLWMFKRAGAKNKNNDTYQFWQQDNHPIELSTNQMVDQRMDYLHTNPVKAGLVWEPQHYKYSSAVDYYSAESGLLTIEKI
ncbi:REP-associated tyrosine transposase [Mucilaginibacter sp.]